MKKYFLLSALLPVQIFLSACSRGCEEPVPEIICTAGSLPVTSLENIYGCSNTKYGLKISLNETYTIIRSQTVFDSLVTSSCTPTIDFSSFDLIIGKKQLTSGNISITYQWEQRCKPNQKRLTVTFQQGMTANAPNLTYHALVPKLAMNESIEVKTVVLQ